MSPLFGRAEQKRQALGARRYWLIWVAVAPVALWALVRLLGLDGGFPLVALMAFTPYAALAALFVAGVATAVRNWAAALVAGLAMLSLAAVILPRAIGDGTAEAAGHETISVLSTNIHRGTAEPAAVIDLVDRYDVDLLSVQELTPRFARELRRAGLERRLPNAVREVHPGSSGAGIYSRLPLRKLAGQQPFFFRMPRAEAQLPDGRRVRVVDIHPYPPGRGNVDIWSEALESLPSTGRGIPWLLVGDFNATLDVSLLRETIDRGYRDAGDVAGKGLEPTWPAGDWASRLLPVTIDHVLADSRLGVVDYEVEDLDGSDHRAVWSELALPAVSRR